MKSKLFNYGSGHSRIFLEKGAYLPGRITETGWKLVRSFSMDNDNPVEYGEVVKFKTGAEGKIITPLEAGDAIADVVGIVLRTHNQIANVEYGANVNQFVYRPGTGQVVSVLIKGLVSVPIQKGTPTYGAVPIIRVQEDGTNAELPIGGIEIGDVVSGGEPSVPITIAFAGAKVRSGASFPMASTVVENVGQGTGQTAVIGLDLEV